MHTATQTHFEITPSATRTPPATGAARRLTGTTALTIAALALTGALTLTPHAARTEVVCDSDAAGESGSGATATGGALNTACGFEADASGNFAFGHNPGNTATGARSDATGDGSSNTATGRQALASGEDSFNTATGHLAVATGDDSANKT